MAKEDRHRRIQIHPGDQPLSGLPMGSAATGDEINRPIGVFDSGVGGLSVLRALRAELPHERFVYVADSGFAPYGERDDAYVVQRSHAITDYLVKTHGIKAMVVACNTATAAAIHTLRKDYASIPVVGIEPALKPAAASSRTGVVGVIATRYTLQSEKFAALLRSLHGQARFILQPCDGLVRAIEQNDTIKIRAACAEYTGAMGTFGLETGEMDTLVLGCTHYPFIADELRACVGSDIAFVEGGAPVAKQTHRLLAAQGALASIDVAQSAIPLPQLWTTGEPGALDRAVQTWLGWETPAEKLAV
jgi:glutamate racemase